jgi:hypothetical protein
LAYSIGLPQSRLNSLPQLHPSALPEPYPVASMFTWPYTFIPSRITLPDSSPEWISTYPALHGRTRPNYLTRSDFCLPNHTRPPYPTSLPGQVTLHCIRLLIQPYPITLPGWVPFNWSHPKTSSSASHLDLGLFWPIMHHDSLGNPKPTRVTMKQLG